MKNSLILAVATLLPFLSAFNLQKCSAQQQVLQQASPKMNYGFLGDPMVRKDLDFVDEQNEKYQEVLRVYGSERLALWTKFAARQNDPDAKQEMEQEMAAIERRKQIGLGEILLPHQEKRYQQVARQLAMKMTSPGGAVQHGLLAKALGITDDQRKELQKIQNEYDQALAKKAKELQSVAEARIMGTLNPEQRKK